MSCGMEAKVAVYAALFGDFLQVGIEARVMQHREQFPIRCHSFILFYNGDGNIQQTHIFGRTCFLTFRFDPQTAVIGLDYIRFSQVAHVAVADSGER